jgi:hypothetical protein
LCDPFVSALREIGSNPTRAAFARALNRERNFLAQWDCPDWNLRTIRTLSGRRTDMALGNYIANIQTDLPWLPGWLIAVTLFFALLAAGFALQYLIMKVFCSLPKAPQIRFWDCQRI